MRVVKFRAWHKKNNCSCGASVKMYSLQNLPLLSYFEIRPYVGFALFESEKGVFYHEHDSSNLEIMQYTCLKDKNGKEIYEGDILEITTTFHSYPIEVIWGDACWTLGKEDTGEYGTLAEWNTTSRVIGNIYENPELLEGNK